MLARAAENNFLRVGSRILDRGDQLVCRWNNERRKTIRKNACRSNGSANGLGEAMLNQDRRACWDRTVRRVLDLVHIRRELRCRIARGKDQVGDELLIFGHSRFLRLVELPIRHLLDTTRPDSDRASDRSGALNSVE
jgi:hypothetical protein